MDKIIELRDITKLYKTGGRTVTALDRVSLSVREGEFVSIVGQSGSGKSTLMNILGCLDKADYGEYYLDGASVCRLKERRLSFIRNSVIGFIFQSFHLIPSLSALENVELPLLYRGTGRRERRRAALEALRTVGLAHRTDHKPCELSGGQQQRVAIARAVAARPRLILADEPTGNLDSRSGAEIMEILRSLHRNDSTVIVITHDSKVADMAQRCITISDGRIII